MELVVLTHNPCEIQEIGDHAKQHGHLAERDNRSQHCLLFHCSTPTNRRSRDLNQDPTEGGEAAIHLVLSWLGYLVDNECCDDGLKLWRDDDGAKPDIDLTRVLVEEEYVLNEHQTALAYQLLATPFYFP